MPAGVYYIEFGAPAQAVDSHQAFLYNVTGAAEVKRGSSMFLGSSVNQQSYSTGATVVPLAVQSSLEIRHRCQTSKATSGFGVGGGFGTEVYSYMRIWKLA